MINTPKVVVIILLAAGIFSFCFSQQEDSIVVKDSTVFADSSSRSDSVFTTKVNKDSAAALDSLLLMQKNFEQFKYGDVISIANKLLLRKAPFTKKDILEIYKMKGISHYSLSEDDAAKKSFIEILRADSSYTLDSTKVSPKIISFFRQVKNDYFQQQKEIEARTVVRIDTVYVPKIEYDYEHEAKLKGAVVRSLIVPGLGQLYRGEYVKGIILTVLSSASIISSVYYIIDSNNKEKAYLVETNSDLIESKYSEYNSSYKKRNISLISFGILWLYSQIDILFLADHETSGNNFIKSSSLHYNKLKGLTLNFKYFF